jgi:transcriptional regulator with XRE-family HTH domain
MTTTADRTRKAFASLLRHHRLQQGLTGRQLDKKARLPFSHVSQIETGSRPCGVQVATRLAAALQLTEVDKRRFLLSAAMTTKHPLWEAVAVSLIMRGCDDFSASVMPADISAATAPKPRPDFLFTIHGGQVWASRLELTRVN